MYYIIDYLKVFACILITNFHLDIVYPESFQIFAIGGDVGNNIFFMISGFCILPSVVGKEARDVLKWWKGRIIKLLFPLITFYIIAVLCGDYIISSLNDLLEFIIFPTPYWFTGALIIFYPVYFILIKFFITSDQKTMVAGGILIILCFLCSSLMGGLFTDRYLIGFLSMLIGGKIRNVIETQKYRNIESINNPELFIQ